MTPAKQCYLCQAPALHTCSVCGQDICEEHERLGVDASGRKQAICLPCDDRRLPPPPPWHIKR